MAKARRLENPTGDAKARPFVIGVCVTGDPRIDKASRQRCVNIIKMVAETIAGAVTMPDGRDAEVVFSEVLIDGEAQADLVARQFLDAGVGAVVVAPDSWAFPQPTMLSMLAQLGPDMPVNITCGNCAPKPGVVYAHALNGALAQSGRLATLNVGNWPDSGQNPKMTPATAEALIDWCYAAMTAQALRGRRIVLFGHDSMGMETALAHVIATRETFGLEITRLDMKLLADMLAKRAFDAGELDELRGWLQKHVGKRIEATNDTQRKRLDDSLAMYLIVRDMLDELNAVGGGFMSQLEWGSDRRGLPLPVADVMESLLNSTFDHRGDKAAVPFATEADTQGLLTMLAMTWLSGGAPPLFMDFRKVWNASEAKALARKLKVPFGKKDLWAQRGFVDGDNSGSASLNWAAKPGATAAACLKKVSLPQADGDYFPGGGNSVSFISPGGIEGIAGRLAYCQPSDVFSMIWDEATTVELPARLAKAVAATSNPTWPHTFVTPRFASMSEYKQYAPANHLHMTWGLSPARLEYWMDLVGVRNVTPWAARPAFIEGTDRPIPLVDLIG
jgi:L-fucose isomerase